MEFTVRNMRGDVKVQVSDEDADLATRRWYLLGGKPSQGQPGKYIGTSGSEYLHRVIAKRMGLIPDVVGGTGGRWVKSIDHENGDKMDNRRENLRLRDRKQQMTNTRDGLQRNNTSGVRGVSYVVSRQSLKKWYAHAMVDHKSKSLGYFLTMEEAVAARRAWEHLSADNHRSGCPHEAHVDE